MAFDAGKDRFVGLLGGRDRRSLEIEEEEGGDTAHGHEAQSPAWGSGSGGSEHAGHHEGGGSSSESSALDAFGTRESNESHEGAEAFSKYMEEMFKKFIPNYDQVKDNWEKVFSQIRAAGSLTLEDAKAFLAEKIAQIKEKLTGKKENRPEVSVAVAKAVEAAPVATQEALAETLRDAEERAEKLAAYNAAEKALEAIRNEPQSTSEDFNDETIEAEQQHAQDRAERLKVAHANLKAAREGLVGTNTAPDVAGAEALGTVVPAAPEADDDVEDEAVDHGAEHRAIQDQIDELKNELNSIGHQLDPLTTQKYLTRKASHHALEKDQSAREKLHSRMNEILQELRELTGAVGPAAVRELEGEEREDLELELKRVMSAVEYISKNEEGAKMRFEVARTERIHEVTTDIEVVHPGEVPAEMLHPDAAALRRVRSNLAEHPKTPAPQEQEKRISQEELTKGLEWLMEKGAGVFDGERRAGGIKELQYLINGFVGNRPPEETDKAFVDAITQAARNTNPELITNSLTSEIGEYMLNWFKQDKSEGKTYIHFINRYRSGVAKRMDDSKETRKGINAFNKALRNLASYA